MNPVVYVFLNKELHMSSGKAAAQAAHAVMLSVIGGKKFPAKYWIESPHRYMIVLEARDEEHMKDISMYLAERNIKTFGQIDEGSTEVPAHSLTAMATPILARTDRIKQIFSTFDLYRDKVKITLEMDK